MIAEKFIAEKSRDYMTARRVAKEYEAITRGIDRSFLSLPPCGSIDEIKQVRSFQAQFVVVFFHDLIVLGGNLAKSDCLGKV